MPDKNLLTRRELLKRTALATAGTLAVPMINRGRYRLFAKTVTAYSARAIDLMKRATVIDMLSPFMISPSKGAKWFSNPDSFTASDLQRFKDSGIDIFHIAVGTGGRDAHLGTLRFIAAWNSFLANHDQHLMRVDSSADLDRVKSSGKVGVLLGVQNSEHFQSVDDVNLFHGLGQRVSQLTYNTRNLIGNGATERRDEGLSDYGVSIVERMNKVGMTVDVSHCGDRTTLDEPAALSLAASQLDQYVGVYQLDDKDEVIIRRDGEKLFASLPGGGRAEIIPSSETQFFIRDARTRLSFTKSTAGVTSFVLRDRYGTDQVARKTDKPLPAAQQAVTVDARVYEAYVGEYEIAPNFTITISKDGNKLMAQATGQPKLDLFPESQTRFFVKEAPIQIEFVVDGSGKATSLVIHQAGQRLAARRIK